MYTNTYRCLCYPWYFNEKAKIILFPIGMISNADKKLLRLRFVLVSLLIMLLN